VVEGINQAEAGQEESYCDHPQRMAVGQSLKTSEDPIQDSWRGF